MPTITLFIPGLFGSEAKLTAKTAAEVNQLNRLLARAAYTPRPYPGFTAQLFSLFGIEVTAGTDYPVAPVSYLGDTNRFPEGYWMRADPVHLTPDYHGLVLDRYTFTVDQDDALALASDLEDLFRQRQMRLEVPTPMRWYIRLQEPAAVRTYEISAVIGRDIRPFLPTGPEQSSWHQLLNEVQMQLHTAAINQKRQDHGQLPINSIWFWGGGQLLELRRQKWSIIYTDDATTKGLAKLSNTPIVVLPTTPVTLDIGPEKEQILIVISAGLQHLYDHDRVAWTHFLIQLEKNWMIELASLLRSSVSIRIKLITELGTFILNKYSMLKFWCNRYFKHAD